MNLNYNAKKLHTIYNESINGSSGWTTSNTNAWRMIDDQERKAWRSVADHVWIVGKPPRKL